VNIYTFIKISQVRIIVLKIILQKFKIQVILDLFEKIGFNPKK